LRLALSAFEQLELSCVHLMLSARPPHKNTPQATSQQRWQMLQLAIEDEPALFADDCEIHREGLSYTIDSLKNLQQVTDETLVLILGSDALNGLTTWHEWQSLLDYCHIVVVKRPTQTLNMSATLQHYLQNRQVNEMKRLHQCHSGYFYTLSLYPPACEVSATMIRHLINKQQNTRYLLPNSVRTFISHHGLYL